MTTPTITIRQWLSELRYRTPLIRRKTYRNDTRLLLDTIARLMPEDGTG